MDRIIRMNTRALVNLRCPECGMNLMKAPQGGFVKYGDTHCCRGCAEGTGCTCRAALEIRKPLDRSTNFNLRDSASQTEAGNSRGRVAKPRNKSRDQRQWEPRSKRLRSQNKKRDSTREQARGRSEQRGKLGRPAAAKNQDRISRTGSKGK